jgi:hypothetical protein
MKARQLGARLIKFVKFLFGFGILLLVLVVAVWLLFPYLVSLDHPQNYLLITDSFDQAQGQIYLLSFDPEQSQVKLQPLAQQLPTTIYHDLSRKQLTIEQWLQERGDSSRQGRALSTQELSPAIWSWLTHVKLEEVLVVANQQPAAMSEQLPGILKQQLFQSNLSWPQRYHYLQLLAAVNKFSLRVTPAVSELEQLEPLPITDGTCTLAVINSTQMSGLAGHLTSLFELNGARVVRVDSAKPTLEKSQLLLKAGRESVCQQSLALVQGFLLAEPQLLAKGSVGELVDEGGGQGVNQEQLKKIQQYTTRYRADLVILLGIDQSL